MKLNLKVEHFIELQKKSYSLDQIFLLKLIQEEKDLTSICNDSVKINTLYNSLIRKGLINEDNCLTLLGEEILSFIDSKGENIKLNNKVVNVNDFDLWWEIFPANNKFDIFKATRTFKVKKDDCKTLFNKYVCRTNILTYKIGALLESKFEAVVNVIIESFGKRLIKKSPFSIVLKLFKQILECSESAKETY